MNDFTASNGISVANHGGNWDRTTIHFTGEVLGLVEHYTIERDVTFEDRDFLALREFFQAEADERLGRWRWPENTNYVVYLEQPGTDWVRVYSESQSLMVRMDREKACHDYVDRTVYQNAARAYFDAHPEPKPWHDAGPAEVWDVDLPTGGMRAVTVYSARHEEPIAVFRDAHTQTEIETDDPTIRDARRIFPEVSS